MHLYCDRNPEVPQQPPVRLRNLETICKTNQSSDISVGYQPIGSYPRGLLPFSAAALIRLTRARLKTAQDINSRNSPVVEFPRACLGRAIDCADLSILSKYQSIRFMDAHEAHMGLRPSFGSMYIRVVPVRQTHAAS